MGGELCAYMLATFESHSCLSFEVRDTLSSEKVALEGTCPDRLQ